MNPRFWMLQANLKIRWKLSVRKSHTFRQCRGASRVVWARVEMRLIFVVRQCEKQLRSKSTSVSSVMMQMPMTLQSLYLKTPGRRFCVLLTWQHRTPWQLRCQEKNAELEYATGQLISFIKRLGYTELVIRSDGEPSITATVDRLMAEIKKTGVQARVRPEKTPRYSSQSLGAVGSMQSTVAETSANSQN